MSSSNTFIRFESPGLDQRTKLWAAYHPWRAPNRFTSQIITTAHAVKLQTVLRTLRHDKPLPLRSLGMHPLDSRRPYTTLTLVLSRHASIPLLRRRRRLRLHARRLLFRNDTRHTVVPPEGPRPSRLPPAGPCPLPCACQDTCLWF